MASFERIKTARRRMLEAAERRDETYSGADWRVWREAAADYWVLKHPASGRFRGLDRDRMPTVGEYLELADQIEHAMDGVPSAWRLMPMSDEKIEHLAQVGWFHELMEAFYGPIYGALEKLKHKNSDGIETSIRFLEADPYCHRSGYAKADAVRLLTRMVLTKTDADRLRAVVIQAVNKPARREFRSYIRLARHIDSDELRTQLRELANAKDTTARRHARWVLIGLGETERVDNSAQSHD